MSTVLTRPTNGVSYGYRYTVTAQDVTDGEVIFDFQVDRDLVANVQVYDANGVSIPIASNADTDGGVTVTPQADMVVTYPDKGKIRVANGTNFALTEGWRIDIIAQATR